MPMSYYVELRALDKASKFVSRFGWLKTFALIIGPVFAAALLFTSEDKVGHSVITPERMTLAAICSSGAVAFGIWRLSQMLFKPRKP